MRTCTWLLTALILSLTAWGQTVVEGMVRDKSGAAVTGATVELQRTNGSQVAAQTTSADGHFRFNAIESGAYRLQATAPTFYSSTYEFVLRPRQPLTVDLELQPKQSVSQQVEVREKYLTVNPEKTGSSYTFTYQEDLGTVSGSGGKVELNNCYYYAVAKRSSVVALDGPFNGDTAQNRLKVSSDGSQIVAVVVLTNSGTQVSSSGGGGSAIVGSPTAGAFF